RASSANLPQPRESLSLRPHSVPSAETHSTLGPEVASRATEPASVPSRRRSPEPALARGRRRRQPSPPSPEPAERFPALLPPPLCAGSSHRTQTQAHPPPHPGPSARPRDL